MKTHPIIFSQAMCRANREGRKNQTRRVITKRPALDALAVFGPEFLTLPGNVDLLPLPVRSADLLWVRENWIRCEGCGYCNPVDGCNRSGSGEGRVCVACEEGLPKSQKPSIHMAREDSKMTLRVTRVRVERVQAISTKDALAEGMTFPEGMKWGCDPVEAFHGLWDSLNSSRGYGWDENPWVAAYDYEVIHQNVDRAAV